MIPACSIIASANPVVTVVLQSMSGSEAGAITFAVRADGMETLFHLSESWISNPAHAADYEVRATLSSGDTPTGTLGAWLALDSDRSWRLDKFFSDPTQNCVLTVEIRDATSHVVKTSATITMTAT